MKGLQTLSIILSFCGYALSAPTCDYKTIEDKYVCLMSDSSSSGTTIGGSHKDGKDETYVYRVTTTDTASKGLIKPVLSTFKNLEVFQIPKGNINNIVADDFVDCTEHLLELQICNGDLSTILDDVFKTCTKLETIDLTSNKFKLAVNGSFPLKLKKLILANNEIKMNKAESTIFGSSVTLPDLSHLDLSGNGIDSVSDSVLPSVKLVHLDMSSNKLKEVPDAYFESNANLEVLHLHDNQLTSIKGNIFKKLTKLKELKIGTNNISTIEAPAFQNNTVLEYLDISSNPIVLLNANLLKHLTTLKTLNIHDNKLNTTSVEPLKTTLLALTNLEKLDISKNVIGSIDELFTKNEKLTELNIGSMDLGELKGDMFNALTKLKSLKLDDNKIIEFPENIFEKTTEMMTFSAKGNKIVRLKASTFEKMTNLTELDFTGNEINAIESTFFDKLIHLKTVKFGGDSNKCIKLDFESFDLKDADTRVNFKQCFDNYNSARTVMISNVLLALVVIFKFI